MKTPKPKQWAEQEIRRLVALARREIAAELGRHAGSVRRMARAKGILLKKQRPGRALPDQRTVSYSPKPLLMSRMSRSAASVLRP
jgi:hypothetical protein